jgi:hypothetical protein
MKFILLAPQPAPKLETAHYRPKTLGEMQAAFLNANNKKSWADEEHFPEIPVSRVFRSIWQARNALRKQAKLLAKRDKARRREEVARRREASLTEEQRFHRDVHTVKLPESARHRIWNEMISGITAEDVRILTEVMFVPNHMLVSRIDPQEPFPAGILRKHIFTTRSFFSFRSVAKELLFDKTPLSDVEYFARRARLCEPVVQEYFRSKK